MNDLIERYIYAVTKRMERRQREDVSLELRGLIEDMLEERCIGREPDERDVRIVLTELGTPQALARQYDADKDKCLIGQPYYTTYRYVMGIVLGCIVIGMTVAHLLLAVLEPGDLFTALLGWFNGIWNGVFGAFAFVTLLFAFFQRKGIRINESFDFDDLPPVPRHSKEISKWESIAGIAFDMIFVVLFLLTPQVFAFRADGMWSPIFVPEVLRACAVPILLFAACGIVREAVQLLEGEYNRKVMITALVADGVSALLALWWLAGHKLLNPAFIGQIDQIFAGEPQFLREMFANFDLFFLGCILFALLLDSIDVTVRTLRK